MTSARNAVIGLLLLWVAQFAAALQPTVVASGIPSPYVWAVDGDSLYFTSNGNALYRVPKASLNLTPANLSPWIGSGGAIDAITFDANSLYVNRGGAATGSITRAPKNLSTAGTYLVSDAGGSIGGVIGTNLYFTHNNGTIAKIGVTETNPTNWQDVSTQTYFLRQRTQDATSIYFTDIFTSSIIRFDAGTQIATVLSPIPAEGTLFNDSNNIYGTPGYGGGYGVYKIPKQGGIPSGGTLPYLVPGGTGAVGYAVGGGYVYYIEQGIIRAIPVSGGTPTDLASAGDAGNVIYDNGTLYWASAANSTVYSTSVVWLVSPAPGPCSLAVAPNTQLPAGGGTITLTANCSTAGGQPTSYVWAGGFASGLSTSNNSLSGNVSQTTTFSVVATNAGGSSPSTNVTAVVAVAPTPPPGNCKITANPSSLPAGGGQVTLSVACASGGVATSFSWSGGFAAGLTTASVTGRVGQTTTFSVVAANTGGPSVPAVTTVTVAAAPPPILAPSSCTVVANPSSLPAGGGIVSLYVTCVSGGLPDTYTWTGFSNLIVTSVSSASGSINQTTTFSVVAGNMSGTASSAAITVNVAPTKIEKRCSAASLIDFILLPYYKNRCDLIAALRSPRGFSISPQQATTDQLFNWLSIGQNEDATTALFGNVRLGIAVEAFANYGPWDGATAKKYVNNIKAAGESAKTLGQAIFDIVNIAADNPAAQFTLRFLGAVDAILKALGAYSAVAANLTTNDARNLLITYIGERCGQNGNGDACASTDSATLVNATDAIRDQSSLVNLIICGNHILRCNKDGSAKPDQFNDYLNWLERQYQAYRLVHYGAASELARQQIGAAIATLAIGQ